HPFEYFMTLDSPAAFLVHVSSSESREIHEFLMDAQTGGLSLLGACEVPGSGSPKRGNMPLAWRSDYRVLYAQVRTAPYPVTAFELDRDSGRLRLLQTCSMPAAAAYLSVTG